MQGLLIAILVTAFTLYVDHKAEAHHSFTAEFDRNQPVEIAGIVTKVEWTNPHVWVYVNVKNADSGKIENWGIELGPPHGLQRNGWRRDTLKIGTAVESNGWKARNGSTRMNARAVTVAGTGGAPGATLDAAGSSAQLNEIE